MPFSTESSDDYECLHDITQRPAKPRFRRKTWLLRGIGLSLLVGLFLATSLTIGRKDNLHKVLLWIHEHRAAGFFIFGLLYIWFTVLFLPPALLAACAGAIYGFLGAIPLVWVCAVLGETVSFLLGRFLLRKWVTELTSDWPMWLALNAALKEDGWKLVALLRVSPAVPFSIINYALGSSSLSFSHYFWPSIVGIVPGLIIYVWLGSLASDVTAAFAGEGVAPPPAAKIVIIVIGIVSALLVMVLSAIYTKRAIDSRLAHVHVHEELQVEEQHLLRDSREASASNGIVVSVEVPVVMAAGSSGARHVRQGSTADAGTSQNNEPTIFGWWLKLRGAVTGGNKAAFSAHSTANSGRGDASDNSEEGFEQHPQAGESPELLISIDGVNSTAPSVRCGADQCVEGGACCGASATPSASTVAAVNSAAEVTRGCLGHPSEQREGGVQRRHSKSDLQHLHLA